MNLKKINREGLITRQPDGSHVVMVKGASYVAALAGVSRRAKRPRILG